MPSEGHSYRKRVRARGLVTFHVVIKETDLWVSADVNLERETRDLAFECRAQVEAYMSVRPEFATSLVPLQDDPYAPPVVREMIDVTRKLGVGPMASIAGAIAQYVGGGLLKFTNQVVVENGGDIFLKASRPVTISILAGASPLSGRVGLLIPVRQMPLGVCSSSATIGHSLSMGIADVVCLVSSSAILADGAATALGNKIKKKADLEKASGWGHQFAGIVGGVIIVEDKMSVWGDVELVEI